MASQSPLVTLPPGKYDMPWKKDTKFMELALEIESAIGRLSYQWKLFRCLDSQESLSPSLEQNFP